MRRFTPAESQSAKEAGYGILADTFGTHAPSINPHGNDDLRESAPRFGAARGAVENGDVRDPRDNVAGLRGDIEAHGHSVETQYRPNAADNFHAANRESAAERLAARQDQVREQVRERIGAEIDRRAILPRPAAQAVHNEVGGTFVKLADTGALASAGATAALGQTVAAAKAFGSTLASGGDVSAAVAAGREAAGGEGGWTQARGAMIDARLQQVAEHGLTDAQQTLFREATNSVFAFAPSAAQLAARQAVIDEAGGGARGQHVADLVERSAVSRDDSDLRLIGTYNTQGIGSKKKTDGPSGASRPSVPRVAERSVTPGPRGEVLDLLARPESRGNYNAWFGNADQSAIDLTRMTVSEVRALQSRLLESGNGGSAIGRYQIIPSTFDGLINRVGLTGEELFSRQLQDRMALRLANDAGMSGWMRGRISDHDFAHSLSRIWAGLPKDASNESFYQKDGVNKAHIDYGVVIATLGEIRERSGS